MICLLPFHLLQGIAGVPASYAATKTPVQIPVMVCTRCRIYMGDPVNQCPQCGASVTTVSRYVQTAPGHIRIP